jgi:aminoglycoside 6-adenylyltransferase
VVALDQHYIGDLGLKAVVAWVCYSWSGSFNKVNPLTILQSRGGDMSQTPLTYEDVLDRFLSWAHLQPDVRAVVIVGSRARMDHPADAFSDLDLVVVTTDPNRYLWETDWLKPLGTLWLTFLENQAVGEGLERRVLFEGALDVDFIPLPNEAVRRMALEGWTPEVAAVLRRGFRFALDKDNLSQLIGGVPSTKPSSASAPTQDKFLALCHDFLYHAVWAAKKLRRGELWIAKSCADGYMKQQLLRMIEWHSRSERGWNHDTWHGGRYLEEWADPDALDGLRETFAHYDEADVQRALLATMDLFCRVGRETAARLGCAYPEDADERVTVWVVAFLRPA